MNVVAIKSASRRIRRHASPIHARRNHLVEATDAGLEQPSQYGGWPSYADSSGECQPSSLAQEHYKNSRTGLSFQDQRAIRAVLAADGAVLISICVRSAE